MMRLPKLGAALLALAAVVSLAHADTIHQPGGGKITFGIDEEVAVKKLEREILSWFREHETVRAVLAQVVKERRKAALDFIMDPKKYPEANHGAAAQPDVDKLVGLPDKITRA